MDKTTEVKPITGDSAVKDAIKDKGEMVIAKVPQGYDTKINIRFVEGSDFQFIHAVPGCLPRSGTPWRNTDPATLSEALANKLIDANKKVIAWLAQDEANAHLFLTRPVESLIKAGVELSRSEQKTLERNRRAISETTMIAPGVKVERLSASVHPTRRIGEIKPHIKDVSDRDCDCAAKKKE